MVRAPPLPRRRTAPVAEAPRENRDRTIRCAIPVRGTGLGRLQDREEMHVVREDENRLPHHLTVDDVREAPIVPAAADTLFRSSWHIQARRPDDPEKLQEVGGAVTVLGDQLR